MFEEPSNGRLFFGPDSRPKKPEKMSVPVCVARSITGYTGSFCPPESARVVNLTMFTKQIGVRRVLPSHADSSCGGEKVGGKMLRRFAAIG